LYTLQLLRFCIQGFDLCEVGQEEVVLKTGKIANRRTLHFALQSLLALFGKYTHTLMFIVLHMFLLFVRSPDRTL